MQRIAILIAAIIIALPLSAATTGIVSDRWMEKETLQLSESGRLSLTRETFREQEKYSWMRLRTDIGFRYGNWEPTENGLRLEFDDGGRAVLTLTFLPDSTPALADGKRLVFPITAIERSKGDYFRWTAYSGMRPTRTMGRAVAPVVAPFHDGERIRRDAGHGQSG